MAQQKAAAPTPSHESTPHHPQPISCSEPQPPSPLFVKPTPHQTSDESNPDKTAPKSAQSCRRSQVPEEDCKDNINRARRKMPGHQQLSKLSSIVKQRRELTQELARLRFEEAQVKLKNNKSIDRSTRSHITKGEIHKIQKAISALRRFEETSQSKLPQLEQRIRQKSIEEERQQLQQLAHNREAHREEALHGLQSIKKRQEERQREIRQRNQHFQQLRNKQYPHDRMQQQWNRLKQKQELEGRATLEQIHQRRSLSLEDITKHQMLYQAQKQKDLEDRHKKLAADKLSMSRIEKETLTQFQPSRFLRTIFQEEQQRRREMEDKKRDYRTYSMKKTQYAQSIKEINQNRWRKGHLKPIQQKGQESLSQEHLVKKRQPSLSQAELLKLGNSYMRQVHSSIEHLSAPPELPKQQPTQESKYEDYLTKMRAEREQRQQAKPGLSEAREVREFKSVLRREGPMEDKLYLVKLLTSKMEERAGRDSRMMVASINAKLEMINQLVEGAGV